MILDEVKPFLIFLSFLKSCIRNVGLVLCRFWGARGFLTLATSRGNGVHGKKNIERRWQNVPVLRTNTLVCVRYRPPSELLVTLRGHCSQISRQKVVCYRERLCTNPSYFEHLYLLKSSCVRGELAQRWRKGDKPWNAPISQETRENWRPNMVKGRSLGDVLMEKGSQG